MSYRQSHRVRPQVEVLESRWVPAGNLRAAVSGGSLIVHGDQSDSAILITQARPGTYVVTATDGTTTINGGLGSATFSRVTRNVHIGLGGGVDSLQIGSAKGEVFAVGRNLVIEGTIGDKTIQALADLRVGGTLSITTTQGNDIIELTGRLQVTGNTNIIGGTGDNSVAIAPSSGLNDLRGRLYVSNQFGNSNTAVFDTNVRRDLSLINSGDAEAETNVIFGVSSALVKTSVGGNALLRASMGRGSIRFLDTDVRGRAEVFAGEMGRFFQGELGYVGSNYRDFMVEVGPSLIDSDMSIRGDIRVHVTGASNVSLGRLVDGNGRGLNVGGKATLLTGSHADIISMAGLSAGNLRMETNAGADLVTLDDSLIRGLVQIGTGAGNDIFRIEGNPEFGFGGQTTFMKAVSINLGDDDDAILAGVLGDAGRTIVLRSTARFDGGAGFNLRELAANLVMPGSSTHPDSAFVNFG